MRKLTLKMSISIDGFVCGPHGEMDWVFANPDSDATAWIVETLWDAGVHVMGSRTFRDMAAYWPTSTQPFADPMNEIPKVYFSRGGSQAAGGSATTQALADARAHMTEPLSAEPATESWRLARVASGDLAEEIARLKQESSGDILAHGGASFAQSLVALDLIDEYRLIFHPVALGRGLPLFPQLGAPLKLQRVDVKAFKGGRVAHVYARR
jgi:dihydrofolate reductase